MCVWRLGVTSQPCVFSQVLDTDPPPSFASCHMMRVSNQNLCRFLTSAYSRVKLNAFNIQFFFKKAFLIVSSPHLLTLFLRKASSWTKQEFVGLFFLKILLGSF